MDSSNSYLKLMAVLPVDCLNQIQSSLLDPVVSISVACRRDIQASLGLIPEELTQTNGDVQYFIILLFDPL